MYEGDVRHLAIRVQVVEVQGKCVIHKDLLTAEIVLPQHPHKQGQIDKTNCATGDWNCRFNAWLKSLTCGNRHSGFRDGKFDEYHRQRFHRPRHGFMRFIISVVIPIVIGAAAGVAIGILSIFVAEIVGGIILRVRGRRNAEYVEIDRKEAVDEELPVYEEVDETPKYTDEKH
jgi:hypothetical protein